MLIAPGRLFLMALLYHINLRLSTTVRFSRDCSQLESINKKKGGMSGCAPFFTPCSNRSKPSWLSLSCGNQARPQADLPDGRSPIRQVGLWLPRSTGASGPDAQAYF